ncbi:MAG: alkaline phosphatase family protein [Aeromicrobium sp.]
MALTCGLMAVIFSAPVTTQASPASAVVVPPAATVTKLLVFVEENHSLAQMKAGMPYAYGLARQYGYATRYTATTHPSLPNYIAIAGGKSWGITNNRGPSSNPVYGSSVFGQAIAVNKTAKVYADGMSGNCSTSGGSAYAVKHNPWPYFVYERSLCQKFDVPIRQFDADIAQGKLPNAGMVVPDLDHDAHDGSLGAADQWFKGWMTKIFAGPDWKSGQLAVVLTADEDDKSAGNVVLTVVIHPSQKARVVNTVLTHHGMTRLYEDVLGAPYLYAAATAPSISGAFGLPVPPRTGVPPAVSTAKVTGFVAASGTSSSISVKWNAIPNAPRYRIQISTSSAMTNPTYRRFTGTSAVVDGLNANTTYFMRIRTIQADGTSISPYTTTPISGRTTRIGDPPWSSTGIASSVR